jgi:hypothetical protein
MIKKSIQFNLKKITLSLGIIAVLTGCSGSQLFENRFTADPSLQNSPQVSTSPTLEPNAVISTQNFPTEIPRYNNATLEEVSPDATRDRAQSRWSSPDPINLITEFYQKEFQTNDWVITQPLSPDDPNSSLIAKRNNLQVTLTPLVKGQKTEFNLDYQPLDNAGLIIPSPQPSNAVKPNSPVTFNDLEQVPQPLRDYIQDLGELGILTPKNGNNFQANAPITRREYARWLVAANNRFYATSPSKQIRLGNKNATPAFSDVPPNNLDFPYIQGLAEAGLIPSPLSNDSSAVLFRPDAILNREDLIAWKVPLDTRKALPNASLETLKETWGFQDTAKIDPKVWRAIYGDFQNGEQANIRRVFGFTTLFQPKRPVTRGEAAAAIGYFGFQGDGLSARDVLGLNKATPSN